MNAVAKSSLYSIRAQQRNETQTRSTHIQQSDEDDKLGIFCCVRHFNWFLVTKMSREKIEELFFQSLLKFENEAGLKKIHLLKFLSRFIQCLDSFKVAQPAFLSRTNFRWQTFNVNDNNDVDVDDVKSVYDTGTCWNAFFQIKSSWRLARRHNWNGHLILIPTNDDKMLLALKCLSNRLVSHKS